MATGRRDLKQARPAGPPTRSVMLGSLTRPFAVYARLFGAPGATAFVVAGFLARLTTSMIGLGVVLAMTAGNRRYAITGAVVSVLVLATALGSPMAGRFADRRGQDWVLPRLTGCFCVAMLAMIVTMAAGGPIWPLFPLGFLAGVTLPVVAPMVRARWTALYQGTDQLRAAYGFETATTEVVFIVGPILVTLLATAITPLAGLTAALLFAVTGCLWLAAQPSTQPAPVGRLRKQGAAALRVPALRTLCVAQIGIGGVFGSVEIVTVAFATAHHARSLTGLLLGLWGLASALTGLIYGAMRVRAEVHRRLVVAVALFICGFVPLLFVSGMAEFTALLVVAGLAMAPASITVFEAVQRVVPASTLTEAVTWAAASVAVGMTAGSLAGGLGVEYLGIHRMFAIPVAFGVAALTAIGVGYRGLRAACLAHSGS